PCWHGKTGRRPVPPEGFFLSWSAALRVRLQESFGNGKAQSGPFGDRYHTVSGFDSLFDQIVDHRVGAKRIFDGEGRGRSGADMQAGKEAGRASPQMRREAQIEGAGERADLHRLADAAAKRRVRLE